MPGNNLQVAVGLEIVAATMTFSLESFQRLKPELPNDPTIPLLGMCPKGLTNSSDTCSAIFISTLVTIYRKKKQSRYPSTDTWIMKIYIYFYININLYS